MFSKRSDRELYATAFLAYEAIKNYRLDYRVVLETAFMKSAEELLTVNRTNQFLYNPIIALKKP